MNSHTDSPAPPYDDQGDEPIKPTRFESRTWAEVMKTTKPGECASCGALDGPCDPLCSTWARHRMERR